ncbi:YijD family membrane protein [Psychromonas arctica]|uniref:YijD family membrane protein n=1 Tax=Psychromonas arctica TaxID=168275 RepID=A0ABU9H6V9_9GAMM
MQDSNISSQQDNDISVKWLIYAFLIGLSTNACFSILTISQVTFSLFPFFTLFFAISHFYRLYIHEANNEGSIRPAWAAFFIGLFSYSAFTSALYPELGSNFISITIALVLAIWLMYKLMFGDKHYSA